MEQSLLIGSIAAVCTTWAFIPQVMKTIQTKDTSSISLSMYIIFTFWVGCWLVYWLIIHELPVIIANSITCILASIVLLYKIKYK